jgi:phosphatidylglycerophosphatase A
MKNPTPAISLHWMLGSIHRTIALGFGSGLTRFAPGTAGTLLAWALYLSIQTRFSNAVIVLLLIMGFLYGCWACGISSKDLGRPDHGSIVWDEIIAFWLILFFIGPTSLAIQLMAFVVFRFFDAIKPWPISWLDQYFKKNIQTNLVSGVIWHGFGIMVDDLVAALFTIILILGIANWFV